MKKIITSFLLLSFSSVVLAMPSVGDWAAYNLFVNSQMKRMTSELTAHNTTRNSFTKTNTTTDALNQVKIEREQLLEDDLSSEEKLLYIINSCESQEIMGSIEVTSVPAGIFRTCRIVTEGAVIHLGVVPFGIVRYQDQTTFLELTEYRIAR